MGAAEVHDRFSVRPFFWRIKRKYNALLKTNLKPNNFFTLTNFKHLSMGAADVHERSELKVSWKYS